MSKKEKPLPKPPGQRKFHEGEDNTPILADRIAEAMAGGTIEEFMKNEIPDSDQARALVSMMMGMTGMLPSEGLKDAASEKAPPSPEKSEGTPSASLPPEDIREAAQSADMERLVDLLKKEHEKRGGGSPAVGKEEHDGCAPTIGKADIDRLLKIASDNGLSPDWVILRAIRLYIREYERTGRL